MNITFPRISVITPSLNSSKYLEQAIQSVLAQNYPNFEHIVVDGRSTDGTLNILRKYPHLKYVSEPDKGQADAMNKGFGMSTGTVIVYLNADDFFAPGAFFCVIPYFEKGAKFVVGRIGVLHTDERNYINDGKATFEEMLRWWEMNAFCYNPVGYFYSREVQEQIGFNTENHFTMDLEFLLNASLKFRMTKINSILGYYRCFPGTKTYGRSDIYTQLNDLRFLDTYLKYCSKEYTEKYMADKQKYVAQMISEQARNQT